MEVGVSLLLSFLLRDEALLTALLEETFSEIEKTQSGYTKNSETPVTYVHNSKSNDWVIRHTY